MKAQFRMAQLDDVPQIIALVQSAYRGESSRQGWTTEADLLDGGRTFVEEVSSIINSAGNKIILMEAQDRLLASVHIKKLKPHTAYLGMFAVSPDRQNQGLGKSLLQHVENLVALEWQCQQVEMTVIHQRKELINWYRRRGYRLTGEHREFPYGDERYGIPKRDDLLLDVLLKQLSK
jgi:ribosomal protein S18 acetylase RimI-like enzyme